jgi:hypothetical protein
VTITLPRRVEATLGASCAILLGGVLGFAWWRHRLGRAPYARFRRTRAALVVAGLVVIAVGSAWRLSATIDPLPACSPPQGAAPVAHRGTASASVLAEKAATWPETGLGLLYAETESGRVCSSTLSDYYVGVPAAIFGTRATNFGDIVLSPGYTTSEERVAIASHEARHRVQWAIGTVIGGPLAFPIAYAVDDFFFPRSRNHFERLAGLETGNYGHAGSGPVLHPAQLAVLAALAAVVTVALVRATHRRRLSRRDAGQPTEMLGTEIEGT